MKDGLVNFEQITSNILLQARMLHPKYKPAVVFDFDGTLIDISTVEYLVLGKERDFETFHRESINCPPYLSVLKLAQNLLLNNIKVFILSGRQERFRALTDYWLAMMELPVDELILRPSNYNGTKLEFKGEAMSKLLKFNTIIAIFENDPDLLQLWKRMKIDQIFKCPELTLI